MIRKLSFRRFVVAALVLLGLFSQFQVVFACKLMAGNAKPVCCCDEPGDMSKGCAMGGGCQDQTTGSATTTLDCCAVSYQEMPSAKATPPDSVSLLVLLLDAPQPPPIFVSFQVPKFPTADHAPRYTRFIPLRVAGTETYLLTNRFRI